MFPRRWKNYEMEIKKLIILIFHTSICCLYCAANIRFTFNPLWEQLGKLTIWDMWIQFFFFGLSAIIDIMDLLKLEFPKLVFIRDKAFASLTVPLSQFVFIMYWGLLTGMRKIKNPNARISHSWSNHVSHTVILPAMLIDMRLLKHRYPSRSEGTTVSVFFGVVYLYMATFQGYTVGHFPYFILDDLNPGYRIMFFIGCIGLICIFYLIGEQLNKCMWGVDEPKLFEDIEQACIVHEEDPLPLSPSSGMEMTEMNVYESTQQAAGEAAAVQVLLVKDQEETERSANIV